MTVYRRPMTLSEDRDYRGGVWHTVASAVAAGLVILVLALIA